ncbi:MAG: Ig-like domain-containing protein [Gemmatimonadaceae bacterium]
MKLLKAVAALSFVVACASPGVPPGGPERHTPPMIGRITPDTNRVNFRGREIVVNFDEVISERPAASVPALADLVLLSPRDGQPNVDWHRDALVISPRRRFRANTTYTLTLLPGIADLRGNVRKATTEVSFSTGPRIPATMFRGVVFDALSGAPIANALVEVRPVSDSTLVYIAAADSTGRFHMRGLPPMQYAIRGYADQNRNRGLDPGEPVDSTRVNLADSLAVELLAFVHDSAGSRLSGVSVQDSTTILATFSTPLDPRTPLDAAHFLLLRTDSTRVPIRSVLARPDTAGLSAAPSPVAPVASQSAVPVPRPVTALTTAARPRPARALLFRNVAVVLGATLQPGTTYVLRALGALAPNGRRVTSDRSFSVAKLPTPADTAKGNAARTRIPPVTPPRTPAATPAR